MAYVNTLPVAAALRRPRGMVKLNGEPMPGWVEWECDNNSFYQADTFRVKFACGGLPQDRDKAWLLSQADLSVELLGGLPADPAQFTEQELASYIIGRADEATFNPLENTVELVGRDYTSQFLDAKTTEKFNNLDPADIAKKLAARHSMTCNTQKVGQLAGNFYQIDHATMTDERTEWDLLTWLAQESGYDVWVSGQTLNFLPHVDPDKDDKYLLRWEPPTENRAAPSANLMHLRLAHNLTVAKDVVVILKSWNVKQKKPFTVTAKSSPAKGSKIKRNSKVPYGQPQVWSRTIPGKTRQQLLEIANRMREDISKHQLRMEAELPADALLTCRTLVQLEGTGTVFDQVYYPDSIVRHMGTREGFTMRVHGKNHPVESTVTI